MNQVFRILLIEDDEDDYVLVKGALSETFALEYLLDWVSSYEAGLSALLGEAYDICLLDYQLGERSGLDLLRQILELGVKTPTILLTGQGTQDIDLEAMRLGAADYLIKGQTSGAQLERSIRYAIERRRTSLALNETKEQLRLLASQLLTTQEEERKRIAGELHDTLGSSLSALRFKIEGALSQTKQSSFDMTGLLESLIPMIRDSIDECRRLQQDLRPPMIDDLGLLITLAWFLERFQSVYSHIRIEQGITLREEDIPDDLKIVIFRIVQEAMNNLAKHSRADRVDLSLGKSNKHLTLSIRDNGRGFDPGQKLARKSQTRGLGLVSMKERADLSGGSLIIDSAQGNGTTIRVSWPVREETGLTKKTAG